MNPILETRTSQVVQQAIVGRTKTRTKEPRSDISSNSAHVCAHVELFEQDRGRAWRKSEWAFKKKADPKNAAINAANRALMKAMDSGDINKMFSAMRKLQRIN